MTGVARIGATMRHRARFTGQSEHRLIERTGHNLPQEAPEDFADAVLTVADWTRV
ncbi:MAG: hypothetical protein WDN69_31270 [Aliidongia sp.]